MPIREIKAVCFVGAGTMGCFNSLVAGLSGYKAFVWDSSAEALTRVPQRLQEMGAYMVGLGLRTPVQIDEALSRIYPLADPKAAVAEADLLSESVFERLELKRQVHQQFDDLCPPHTIMTTNTSTLLVSRIEDAVRRGDRFAALHAHLLSDLYDIVGGPRTSPETIAILFRYVRSLGGIPIVLRRERPGYLYNALFGSILRTAMMLVIEGRARMEDVDRAWMIGFNDPAGPFGMMDFVGLNVVFDGASENALDPETAGDSQKIVQFVRPYIERGELGVKTGKGFYSYPDPVFLHPDFRFQGEPADSIREALFLALTTTALLLVIDDYATFQEVDRAWMAAQKEEAGPFALIDQKGIEVFAGLLERREAKNPTEETSKQKIQNFLGPYLKRGDLGIKKGQIGRAHV
jgi:enoyl-CoA hydratase/3-hydroxyacyl-CoA dehydrogenase